MQSKNGYPAFHFFCILAVKPNASSDTRFWGLSERATGPGALTPAVEEEAEAGREALTPAVEEALVAEKLEAFVTFPTLMAERTFTASLSFISFCFSNSLLLLLEMGFIPLIFPLAFMWD